MNVAKIKKLHPKAKTPTKGSLLAAGYDLYACFDEEYIDIKPGENAIIPTGLSITPPDGCFGAIFARSGLAHKQGLRPSNAVGICDEDYTGEYLISLRNDSQETRLIYPGERVAQLVFLPYVHVSFEEVDDLKLTLRGVGGFGSTGN